MQGNQEGPHSSQTWWFSTELCVQTRLKAHGEMFVGFMGMGHHLKKVLENPQILSSMDYPGTNHQRGWHLQDILVCSEEHWHLWGVWYRLTRILTSIRYPIWISKWYIPTRYPGPNCQAYQGTVRFLLLVLRIWFTNGKSILDNCIVIASLMDHQRFELLAFFGSTEHWKGSSALLQGGEGSVASFRVQLPEARL